MQFKSQNAAQFAFWNKNLRICLGHKVPISQKKSENCGRFCQKITNYISKYIFKGIKFQSKISTSIEQKWLSKGGVKVPKDQKTYGMTKKQN